MSTLEQRSAVFDDSAVRVTFTALKKTERLFDESQLIRRVVGCNGTVFRDRDGQNYHLKTRAPDQDRWWVIVFAVDRNPPGVAVITQMHNHVGVYGAPQYEHIQDAKRYFADRAPDSVLDGDSR